MRITPQFRLAGALVMLMLSTVLVADFFGLLPRPERQLLESRKILGESLAVQLSSAAGRNGYDFIEATLEEIVRRNEDIRYAALVREDGREIASFGDAQSSGGRRSDRSSPDDLIIPIFEGDVRWGTARLQFAPSADWSLRYLGMSRATLAFLAFLCVACLFSFYLFMRKALSELSPSKVVPQRVTAALDVLAEGVLIIDEQERIVLANSSFANKLGLEREQMIGRNPRIYDWDLRGDDLEELPWQTALKRGEHVTGMPLNLEGENERISFTVNAAPIEDSGGIQKGVLITFDDVTPIEAKNAELAAMLTELSFTQQIIEEKNRQLEALATRDPLTGCLNRRSFLQGYQELYLKAAREDAPLSVLMVDIDNFKVVNDRHGHIVGDQAIKYVARMLDSQFGAIGSFGRYGGEEFVVVLPGKGLAEGLSLAEQLRQAIEIREPTRELPLDLLTVSVGVSSYDAGIEGHTQLLDRADRALYQAKESGRNRVCQFDPGYANARGQAGIAATSPPSGQSAKDAALDALRMQLSKARQVINNQASEITRRSMYDALTGLPNRFLLLDRLAQAMKASDRNDNITAVVCVSLSGYRQAYDFGGHEAADQLIREAAERVENVVRSVDSIGVAYDERALTFSRIAENELAMLVVDLDAVASIAKILGRVRTALERSFTIGENVVNNDVYCGVALYPHDSKEPELLVRNASLARRYAERRSPHRSNSAYFSRDIDSLAAKNASIAAELRKAIQGNGLSIAYQPKMDPVTNKITGCEALARWSHPEFGAISPTEFIAIAEDIGLVHQVTDWVLARVCEDIAKGTFGDMRVSVNISPVELHDFHTARRILGIIRSKGVSPSQLEIEITESSVLNNFELARRILGQFQEAGVYVVLDDFGTAYSSLNLLLEIPVDVIKVDRSFVSNLHNAPENRAVVRAIIQMARAMGKRVVAEGVESVEERDCLMMLGCREIQGFFCSRPVPIDAIRTLIERYGVLEQSSLASVA